MAESRRIALIELGDSHEETLHSQVRFLQRGGFRVHLLVAAELEPRLPETGADVLEVLPPCREWGSRLRALIELRRYLGRHGLDRAVLNTAEGARARDFCLTVGSGVEVFGVVHDGRKLLGGSTTQGWISRRIRSYLVLADYVERNLRAGGYRGRLHGFHPVFYPHRNEGAVVSAPGTLTVCIPGNLAFRRRDYAGLREALAATSLDETVRLVFLGNSDAGDGPAIRSLFEEWDGHERCRFLRGFVDPAVFYAELAAADLVLPLIDPSTPLFRNYLTYQISGTFPLAVGFRKPMLMHEAFRALEEFRDYEVFHADGELVPALNRLARDRSPLEAGRAALDSDRFAFEPQARRYVEFVEGAP